MLGNGQFGAGTCKAYPCYSMPVSVSGLADVFAIASGPSLHTCAQLSSGAVKCWGSNNNGELGDGTTTDALAPVTVRGLTP